MNAESLSNLLEFATDLAWRAGRITLAHFQTDVVVERKTDTSPVTLADRQAERLLRQRIANQFPDDGIVGEEFGAVREAARRRWIIDPIDGTRAFVRGVPLFGVLIALELDGDALIGVIHLPALQETLCAARDLGCWWNSRRARASTTSDLAHALILTTDFNRADHPAQRPGWERLCARSELCRTWGDCYGYTLVATGRAEAMIDPSLSIWDAAAVAPIITEAGGLISDLDGKPSYSNGSLVATNAPLGHDIRALLRAAP